jgi:hypothetical protein
VLSTDAGEAGAVMFDALSLQIQQQAQTTRLGSFFGTMAATCLGGSGQPLMIQNLTMPLAGLCPTAGELIWDQQPTDTRVLYMTDATLALDVGVDGTFELSGTSCVDARLLACH